MGKVTKTFVDGQPLTAADLNSIKNGVNALYGDERPEATDCNYVEALDVNGNPVKISKASLTSVVADIIKSNTTQQAKVTFGAGTPAELASVVAGKWGIKPVIIPQSKILKVSISNNTMATIIYGASLYMNDYPQTFCATVSFYNGNPLLVGYVSKKSNLYPMIYAKLVSANLYNLYEIYFRAAFYIPTNALVLSANASTEIVTTIPSDATAIGG